MEYYCQCCDYKTYVKCNYIKHLNTTKHILNSELSTTHNNNNESLPIHNNNTFICNMCDKEFASRYSLKRHKKKYCILRHLDENQKLENEKRKLEIENQELKEHIIELKEHIIDLRKRKKEYFRDNLHYKKLYYALDKADVKECLKSNGYENGHQVIEYSQRKMERLMNLKLKYLGEKQYYKRLVTEKDKEISELRHKLLEFEEKFKKLQM